MQRPTTPDSKSAPTWWSGRSHPDDRRVLAEAQAREERARAERVAFITGRTVPVCSQCRQALP